MRQLVASYYLVGFKELIVSITSQGPRGLDLGLPVFLQQRSWEWESSKSHLISQASCFGACQVFINTDKSPKAPHANHFLKKIPYSKVQGSAKISNR